MRLQIHCEAPQNDWAVLRQTENHIALVAEQATNSASFMIMIDMQTRLLAYDLRSTPADAAQASLRIMERLIAFERQTITAKVRLEP